jgi:hypothetical protein
MPSANGTTAAAAGEAITIATVAGEAITIATTEL